MYSGDNSKLGLSPIFTNEVSSSMLSFFFSDMMDKKSVNFSFLLKLIFVRFSGIASSEKDNVTIIILINNRRFRYAKAANTLNWMIFEEI